jgi:hypothetical protein
MIGWSSGACSPVFGPVARQNIMAETYGKGNLLPHRGLKAKRETGMG